MTLEYTRLLQMADAVIANNLPKSKGLSDALRNARNTLRVGKTERRFIDAERRLAHEVVKTYRAMGAI